MMTVVSEAVSASGGKSPGLFARERIVAGPHFNRWRVPAAALAVYLCIGMAYGLSMFWLPMSKLLPGAASCENLGFFAQLSATSCNWTVPVVTHIFETLITVLGISAAIWGGWVDRVGPRRSGFIAALCWGGGLVIGGIGVSMHQLWIIFLGCGVLSGMGQGLGYLSPLSTLLKWFPDRRGLAVGFAVMGYGGGAAFGTPIAMALMTRFTHGEVPGVAGTLIVMGVLYVIAMSAGAFGLRVPPNEWTPRGWTASVSAGKPIRSKHVHVKHAWRTSQFWLIWMVLCMSIMAGTGMKTMVAPILQDVFGGGRLLGIGTDSPLTAAQKAAIAASTAGLFGLFSLVNSLGRIFWGFVSDLFGRKKSYIALFVLGALLYCSLPTLGHLGLVGTFVVVVCMILSLYGGGFAMAPAYLADIFGAQMVGAIYGRLLTAWSVAGVGGSLLIVAMRKAQIDSGVAKVLVYDHVLYMLAGLLLIGLICNVLIKPVDEAHHMSDEELEREHSLQREPTRVTADTDQAARGRFGIPGFVVWALVGIPFLFGVWVALSKAAALF